MEIQELFNDLLAVPCAINCMLIDLDDVQRKHKPVMETQGYTNAYWDDISKLADKHHLQFTHPKFLNGLSVVNHSKTMH